MARAAPPPPDSKGGARAMIFMVVSVIAGVAALVIVYKLIQGYQERIAEAQKPADTVMAIVAARDLYQGVTITEEDLFAVEIPPQYLDETVFRSPEHVVGRVPRERVLANEFIREERLADADEGIGLNAIIPRGMRAISINVADGAALSGFLNPGNYVDLLVTLRTQGQGTEVTETLLQAVYVLAVNSRLTAETHTAEDADRETARARETKRFKPSVTLAVTPDQAEQVAHAEKEGKITLALRNDLDVGFAEVDGANVAEVLGEQPKVAAPRPKAAPKPAPEPTGPTLTIIRSTKVEEVHVEDQKGKLPPQPAPAPAPR